MHVYAFLLHIFAYGVFGFGFSCARVLGFGFGFGFALRVGSVWAFCPLRFRLFGWRSSRFRSAFGGRKVGCYPSLLRRLVSSHPLERPACRGASLVWGVCFDGGVFLTGGRLLLDRPLFPRGVFRSQKGGACFLAGGFVCWWMRSLSAHSAFCGGHQPRRTSWWAALRSGGCPVDIPLASARSSNAHLCWRGERHRHRGWLSCPHGQQCSSRPSQSGCWGHLRTTTCLPSGVMRTAYLVISGPARARRQGVHPRGDTCPCDRARCLGVPNPP